MAALTPFNSGKRLVRFYIFSKQKFEQSAVVPNVLLTGTLLISVYKTKCVLALNFRKCHIL